MTEKVFGIGFPKTGTTSLEVALGHLGYKVCRGDGRNNHSNYLMALYVHRDHEELARVIRHFDAFFDLPWGGSDLYRWLAERYPDARFVLSIRDPEAWYDSLMRAALEADPDPGTALEAAHAMGRYGAVLFIRRVWGLESLADAKPRLIALFEAHNRAVIDYFRGQDRLLVADFTKNPEWDPLCGFLGKPEPVRPFPHKNPGKPSAT